MLVKVKLISDWMYFTLVNNPSDRFFLRPDAKAARNIGTFIHREKMNYWYSIHVRRPCHSHNIQYPNTTKIDPCQYLA